MENKAIYHLPGLFEFYDLYKLFLPLFFKHKEYFYDYCTIGSIYGSPADYLWAGGRNGALEYDIDKSLQLVKKYGISPRLTFSNSLLKEEHLNDIKCNELAEKVNNSGNGGIIIASDLLLNYLKTNYPDLYFVSSTTKVLTDFKDFEAEVNNEAYKYVVPDFRLNKRFNQLDKLSQIQKDKVEFLCNECCYFGCKDRKGCYENVSKQNLGLDIEDFNCQAPEGNKGYVFSKAMENPGFIAVKDIEEKYLKVGFTNFKIEGRNLGNAMILEFLLYYLTKPEYVLKVREHIYLDAMLDLF